MKSKRYKKLPNDTKSILSKDIEQLLSTVKKNCTAKFDEAPFGNFNCSGVLLRIRRHLSIATSRWRAMLLRS